MGAERLFSVGLIAGLRPFADCPVLPRTERGGWALVEHRAQCRRGADPSVMAAVALHYGWRVDDGGRIASPSGGHGPSLAAARSSAGDWFITGRRLAASMRWRSPNSKRARGCRKETLKYKAVELYIWLLSLCYVLCVRGARGDQRLGQPVYVRRRWAWDLVTANTAYRCLSGWIYRRAGGGLGPDKSQRQPRTDEFNLSLPGFASLWVRCG